MTGGGKVTAGPWFVDLDEDGAAWFWRRGEMGERVLLLDGRTRRDRTPSWVHCDNPADARLIAEAGTVYHETGLTPRQLAEQRGELVAALEGCLAQCVDRHDAEGSTQAQFMQIELARTALSRARTPATDREDS